MAVKSEQAINEIFLNKNETQLNDTRLADLYGLVIICATAA